LGPNWVAMPEATRGAFKQQSGPQPPGMPWGLALGLSLVGATLAQRRREHGARTSCGISRHKLYYGDDGPPKPQKWATKGREFVASGMKIPAWLNTEKIAGLKAADRARTKRWYLSYFDANGNVRFPKDAMFKLEEAADALVQMQATAPLKFDPTVEVKMMMNLNPQFPDQQIRFTVELPHGTGKDVKVAVFCDPEEEEEVMALGAHKCGKLLAEEIAEETIDFDVLLTKPAMMPRLAKLGKILGPRKLMPSPKSGTVVTDYKKAIEAFKKGGTVELRNDRDMAVNCIAGKVSFGKQKIVENVRSLLEQMVEKAPEGATSDYWKVIRMKSSMSPICKIATSEFPALIAKKSSSL